MSAHALELNTQPEPVQRRMWRYMIIVLVAGTVASAVAGGLKFSVGFAVGGTLALFNFRWLIASVRAILAQGPESVSRWTPAKFILRWIVVAGAGYAAYATGLAKPVGILTGLLVPAAAVMIEAGYLVYLSVSQHLAGEEL